MKNYREIFGNIDIASYREAAWKFLPDKIKALFIFESPPYPPPVYPISKKINPDWSYFFNYKSSGSNNLRRIMCKTLFDKNMDSAEKFLKEFSGQGYFLVDAVNYPINDIIQENKHLIRVDSNNKVSPDERVKIIHSEAGELIKTINFWAGKSKSNLQDVKMIVIKATVFKGLFAKGSEFKEKVDVGIFNVLNDFKIDYPLFNINTFKEVVRKLLDLNFSPKI
jgi:hypothetical protein